MLALCSIVRKAPRSQPRPRLACAGALLVLALAPSCDESAPATGRLWCDLATTPDRCLACQAQRCGAELDRCYGPGFHQGRVAPELERCQFDSELDMFRGNCSSVRFADAGPFSVACYDTASCLAACGCGEECVRKCRAPTPDGGTPTLYYSNDPREAACAPCVEQTVAPCTRLRCAVECR